MADRTERILETRRVDRSSATPLYQQVKEILVDAINRGEFAPGELMPGERELEEFFQVSRITIRQALRDLADSGYLRREPGRGTFVLRSLIDDSSSRRLGAFMDTLQSAGHNVSSRILSLEWQRPSGKLARLFGIRPETEVLRLDRVIYVDEKPVALALHWINISREEARPLTREVLESINIWDGLEHYCRIVLTNGEKTLQSVGANAMEAEILGVPKGTPMMLTEISLRNSQGQPIIFAKVIHLGSSYKYHTFINR